MQITLLRCGAVAALSLMLVVTAAALPRLFNYQGMLTDSSGVPITGNHDLTFSIYESSSPYSLPLWTEQHDQVAIEDGLFNVILGETEFPPGLFGRPELWIGIKVDTDPEIEPRMRMTSVPWAMHAAIADSARAAAGGADADWIVVGDDMYAGVSGSIGIGTTQPARPLEVAAPDQVVVRFTSDTQALYHPATIELKAARSAEQGSVGLIRFLDQSNQQVAAIRHFGNTDAFVPFGLVFSVDNTTAMRVQAGRVGIGNIVPGETLDVDGNVRCEVLKITGGADLAEPFDVADETDVEPGTVMVIDPTRPGQLQVSRHAYDRCAAGVISGAGGIDAGLLMGRTDSAADGSCPVALTGRVYCRATAANGPIEPGDLLTTSDLPGHAMKVTDHARAVGAIIGKAMTALPAGEGLVLTLVGLQ
jgi:hypothetical protein